jgi:hypothetical protein
MDSNQDDSKRRTKKDDRDLPGYPHYPPEEDIMNPQTGYKKISADEELANSKSLSGRTLNKQGEPTENPRTEGDDIRIVRGTEADVTKEDLQLLGPREGDLDLGDDEQMHASARVDDVPNEDDLDVPGADLDDNEEELGEEDEENNYYSLGGDRHENLEEDQSLEEDKDQSYS